MIHFFHLRGPSGTDKLKSWSSKSRAGCLHWPKGRLHLKSEVFHHPFEIVLAILPLLLAKDAKLYCPALANKETVWLVFATQCPIKIKEKNMWLTSNRWQ